MLCRAPTTRTVVNCAAGRTNAIRARKVLPTKRRNANSARLHDSRSTLLDNVLITRRTTKLTDSHERRCEPRICKDAKHGAHGCSVERLVMRFIPWARHVQEPPSEKALNGTAALTADFELRAARQLSRRKTNKARCALRLLPAMSKSKRRPRPN